MQQTFCLLDLLNLRQSKINFVFGFIISFNCRLRLLEYFFIESFSKDKRLFLPSFFLLSASRTCDKTFLYLIFTQSRKVF